MALASQCAFGQEGVASAGSTAASTGGNVSWTVGQPFYTSASSPSGSVDAGVQQGFEFRPVSGWLDVTLTAEVWPNPTPGQFVMTTTLVTMSGEVVSIHRVTEAVTQFDASGLAAGTYLLNIVNADGVLVRTFKVMKK